MAQNETPFGETLRLARVKAGLSQGELAAKAGIGPDTVSRLESGHQAARPNTLQRLADALGIQKTELLHGDKRKHTIVVEESVYAGLYRLGHSFGEDENDIIKRLISDHEDSMTDVLRGLRAYGFLDGQNDVDLKANFDRMLREDEVSEHPKLKLARYAGLLPRPQRNAPGIAARVFRQVRRFVANDRPRKMLLAMQEFFISSSLSEDELQRTFEQWLTDESMGIHQPNLVLARAYGLLPSLPDGPLPVQPK